jgi:hypothetical protein
MIGGGEEDVELDLTRVPRGELAARTLVEGLAGTDDRAERHFLEMKSSIDPMSKEGLAKVAKFILGAANRMPDVAARYFEGHAVMVLGVASGSTPGIQPVEALDIERGVRPYLSVNGPRWDLQRVPVDNDREVLLILVDPPKTGQPAFPCFKDGPGLNNGQIIVRADGETRQATGEEVLLLQQRGRLDKPDVDLSVAVEGVALAIKCDPSVIDEHIQLEEARLESATQTAEYSGTYGFTSTSYMPALGQRREGRTAAEYEEEIVSWAAACRDGWASAIDKVAAAFTQPVVISITNREQVFLEDVQLQIHIDGPVRGLEPQEAEDFDAESLFPCPPRPWGPWTEDLSLLTAGLLSNSHYVPPATYVPSSLTFRNDGSVTVEVSVGDLRPRKTYRTDGDEMVLVVDGDGLTELRGTWKVTARGHHAVFEGELVIPVEPRDFTAGMTHMLSGLRGEAMDIDEE